MTPEGEPTANAGAPSYEEVASAYGGALERLSLGYEAHAERRRDLVQEIHVALFRALPSYEGRSSLRTWVYRVAHNVARDHVIRRSRDGFLRCVPIEDAADQPGFLGRIDWPVAEPGGFRGG